MLRPIDEADKGLNSGCIKEEEGGEEVFDAMHKLIEYSLMDSERILQRKKKLWKGFSRLCADKCFGRVTEDIFERIKKLFRDHT